MNKSSFFIVGQHAVIEALKNPNRKVLRVFLTEESKKNIHRKSPNKNLLNDVKVYFKTKKELDKYSTKENLLHQGYVAEIEHLEKPILKEFIKKKENLTLVCLDGVTDPRNIGALIRSAASFNIDGIIIKERLDDSFLDPKAFNKDSLIGVPGLFKCWLKKNVGILNAVGTGVADDKVVYSYVNKMITYYLGEQPILDQVETYLCHDETHKKYVIENISKLVVKPANASGGYGIMIGPKAPKKEIEETIIKIKKNPREYIAQPLEILSTAPTITEHDIEPRHLDLRPFILTGKTNYVTTGGLTRVALRKGSTIVNSSQGGGSKDTLIVD